MHVSIADCVMVCCVQQSRWYSAWNIDRHQHVLGLWEPRSHHAWRSRHL